MRWLKAVAIGFDVLTNAITDGQAYQTISCRIGESIKAGGWASRVPWPASWRQHFLGAVFDTTV
jgi:hypothetical protein